MKRKKYLIEFKFAYIADVTEPLKDGSVHSYRKRVDGIEIIEAELPEWVVKAWRSCEDSVAGHKTKKHDAFVFLHKIGKLSIPGICNPVEIVEA